MNKEQLKTLGGKVFTKSHFKKLGICLVICAMATGGGTYYIHQQKIARKVQVAEARSAMVTAQAARSNITLLPENQIRTLTAQTIGQEESDITFREISLKSSQDKDHYEHKKDHDKDHDRDHDKDHEKKHDREHDKRKYDKEHKEDQNHGQDTTGNSEVDGTTHATDKRQAMVGTTPVQPAEPAPAQPVMSPATSPALRYKVKCSVGSVKYELAFDAVNGNLLYSEID